jgi:prepilin peptidase CpaA
MQLIETRGGEMDGISDKVRISWEPTNIPRYATGLTAALLLLLWAGAGNISLVHLLASVFLVTICLTDAFTFKIPNLANLLTVLSGFGINFWLAGPSGLLTAFLGMATGFSLLIAFYLLKGMRAGDSQALAALGALLGPAAIFQVFLYMGLIGGVMAALHYAFNRNLVSKTRAGSQTLRTFFYTHDLDLLKPAAGGESLRFPYAAAIAFGFHAHARWGALIPIS